MLKLEHPIVSVNWLKSEIDNPNLIILDASIPKVTSSSNSNIEEQIPNAQFFDIKQKFSDVNGQFPSTLPSEEQFQKEAKKLGVNTNSTIVVYDDKGIYSSARAWWLFKVFGFNNVAVLDGGLPAWKNAGFKTEEKNNSLRPLGNFKATYHPSMMRFFKDIQAIVENKNELVVDARSKARFNGTAPEPREELRSGHIPNSVNLPFENLLEEGQLKNIENLKALFSKIAKPEEQLVFSCGSGITACVLALGATLSGYKNISVYDGSWTEYGTLIPQ